MNRFEVGGTDISRALDRSPKVLRLTGQVHRARALYFGDQSRGIDRQDYVPGAFNDGLKIFHCEQTLPENIA